MGIFDSFMSRSHQKGARQRGSELDFGCWIIQPGTMGTGWGMDLIRKFQVTLDQVAAAAGQNSLVFLSQKRKKVARAADASIVSISCNSETTGAHDSPWQLAQVTMHIPDKGVPPVLTEASLFLPPARFGRYSPAVVLSCNVRKKAEEEPWTPKMSEEGPIGLAFAKLAWWIAPPMICPWVSLATCGPPERTAEGAGILPRPTSGEANATYNQRVVLTSLARAFSVYAINNKTAFLKNRMGSELAKFVSE